MKLPVKLTEEEKKAKLYEVSRLLERKAATKRRQKRVSDAFKKKVTKIENQIEALNAEVQTGEEAKEVEVFEKKEGAFSCLVRADTRETISRRRLTESEREATQPKKKLKKKSSKTQK